MYGGLYQSTRTYLAIARQCSLEYTLTGSHGQEGGGCTFVSGRISISSPI